MRPVMQANTKDTSQGNRQTNNKAFVGCVVEIFDGKARAIALLCPMLRT